MIVPVGPRLSLKGDVAGVDIEHGIAFHQSVQLDFASEIAPDD